MNCLLAIAALGTTALLVPAPAQAGFGLHCGITSSNDPTGLVSQDPNQQFGLLNCGPWVEPGANSVTFTCTGGFGTVTNTTPGPVGHLEAFVSYDGSTPGFTCTVSHT